MQRSVFMKSAIVLIMAGSLLAQTGSKSASAKKPAPKSGATSAAQSSGGAAGLPTKATIMSFLKHTFNYAPTRTFEVKDVKLVPGTQIADATIAFSDSAKPGNKSDDSHLYILSDRKHAIAGNMAPFDAAEPKMASGLPTQSAVNEFVRKRFMNNAPAQLQTDIRKSDLPGLAEAQVLVQGGQGGGRLYITNDGKWVMTGEVLPFGADPFAETRAKLAKANGITRGPANAAVTVVEFSDLQCPACKAAQPTVDQVLKEEPDVKFVFQHYPLEQIHPWAMRAAQFADCVGRDNNTAFWKFIEGVYADQSNISTSNVDQKLLDIAGSSGANKDKVKACADSPDTKSRIWASQALGKQVEVQGTPTVFINGRKVSSVAATGVQNMKMLIDAAKKDK